MKKTLLALAATLAATALPTVVHAEDSPFSGNISITSDYRYRGISQTRLKPALQAGFDYAPSSGFYAGTWMSSIKWVGDFGGSADVEWDFYGGYKGEIQKDLGFDVGILRYQYPGANLAPSPNTTELYGALTYGPATLKYSHSVTNLFGFADSKNSGYLDLSATFDLGGISVVPHLGYQKVSGNSNFSYTDYSLTASKEFFGFTFSGAVIGTSTKSINGVKAYASPANGKDLGRAGLVVAVKKTF